jgi:hypothetical protein
VRDVRDRIPRMEYQLTVIERAGLSQIQIHDAAPNASLAPLIAVIDHLYRFFPEALRNEVERGLRRDARAIDRSRESISMGDL